MPDSTSEESELEPGVDPDDLVKLKDRGEGTFGVVLTDVAEFAGIERGDIVYPELDQEGPGPHPDLILAKVEDESQRTRTVTGNSGGTLTVRIPPIIARDFVEEDEYDADNPFLFEPLPGEGIIGLMGLGRADDVLEESTQGNGPDGEEEVWDHPIISEQTVQIAADSTTAAAEQIKQGIDVVTEAVTAIETLETNGEYEATTVDQYEVQFLDKGFFATVGEQAGLDPEIVDGVEIALELAVETELEDRELTEYRGFKRQATPVLTKGSSSANQESEQQTLAESTE